MASASMPQIHAYSVKAKAMVVIQHPKVVRAKNGRMMVQGVCPATGAKVCTFTSKAQEGGFLPFLAPLIPILAAAGKAAAVSAATAAGAKTVQGITSAVERKRAEAAEKKRVAAMRRAEAQAASIAHRASARGKAGAAAAAAPVDAGSSSGAGVSALLGGVPAKRRGGKAKAMDVEGHGLFMPGQRGKGLFMPGGR